MTNSPGETFRKFTLQAAVLAWSALIVFWVFYSIDHYWVSGRSAAPAPDPFARFFGFTPDSNAVASLSGVNIAVFGIVITVVSIIVQLSADRYTGVARMFLRDRVNIYVSAYYVITCVVSVWLSASLHDDFVPRTTLAVMLCLCTGSLVIMMPYFGYVFWFLDPQNLIRHIREHGIKRAGSEAVKLDSAECSAAQADTVFALEELTDIANNSISGKDKIIATSAVDALKDFAVEYLATKSHASEAWFAIGPEIKLNPDFVAMDAELLGDLETRKTWVEWKVMRQYLSIYNEALSSMRDINYVIAIDTRYIGEEAGKNGDFELIELVFRFLNSYIRATLNADDVRTAYNILNQYRKLVETLLQQGQHRAALDGVKHMKYYGLVAFEKGLSFVTETVAYDLAAIAQGASEAASPVEAAILAEFLELDRPPFVRGHDNALMGVRKAQAKLAAYYLASGQDDRAKAIAHDMRDEPMERLLAIRRQLQTVVNKDFWEIIDRGRNFEYMAPAQREHLTTFFQWLNVAPLPEPSPEAAPPK